MKLTERYCLGKINSLTVLRLVSIGAYLEWSTQEGILLPLKYLPEKVQVGDKLNVMVYHDNEGRIIATTLIPLAQVGDTAYLRCISTTSAGAFLEWGIHKDLFVPFAEQRTPLVVGHSYSVHVYIDRMSGKIVGSTKLRKHIGNTIPSYTAGSRVTGLVVERTDIGYKVVIDNCHWGMLYLGDKANSTSSLHVPSSTVASLNLGERIQAYVVRIREDGKIDLSLSPVGYSKIDGQATHLMRLLRQHGGSLPIGDKSPSKDIEALTGMSKKTFKMVVGKLFKSGKLAPPSPSRIQLR